MLSQLKTGEGTSADLSQEFALTIMSIVFKIDNWSFQGLFLVCVCFSDFLSTAEDLRVKGLYQADKPQNSGHNKTPKTSSAAALKRSSTLSNSREFCGHNKRQKTESPILVDDRAGISCSINNI